MQYTVDENLSLDHPATSVIISLSCIKNLRFITIIIFSFFVFFQITLTL